MLYIINPALPVYSFAFPVEGAHFFFKAFFLKSGKV